MIVDTYINKLNKPANTDREKLIIKLKKRFIEQYNIDTTPIFSGNRLYIFMINMDDSDNQDIATEPIEGYQIQSN